MEQKVINNSFDFITSEFGILYTSYFRSLVFLGILAFGNMERLFCDTNSNKDYSDFSWASMLFCTELAVQFYTGVQPSGYLIIRTHLIHYHPKAMRPQYGQQAMAFHWGPITWTLYTSCCCCISYHHKKIPILKLSAACEGVLGEYSANGLVNLLIFYYWLDWYISNGSRICSRIDHVLNFSAY